MWTGHSKHLVLVEKHVGVGADGTGHQGEAGTRGGDPSTRKSEAELCQFLKCLNQSPGKSYLYSARQPEPHQDQTLCGRGLEICSLNQRPRDCSVRSSSPAGRMTCRSATSRGSAQLLTAATPLTARAPRAIHQRTTGSSSEVRTTASCTGSSMATMATG